MWCSPAEATRIGVGVRIALTRQRRASESRDGSVGMGRRVATRRKEGRRPPPQTASLMSGLLRRTSAFFPSNRRDLTSEALIGAPRMRLERIEAIPEGFQPVVRKTDPAAVLVLQDALDLPNEREIRLRAGARVLVLRRPQGHRELHGAGRAGVLGVDRYLAPPPQGVGQ